MSVTTIKTPKNAESIITAITALLDWMDSTAALAQRAYWEASQTEHCGGEYRSDCIDCASHDICDLANRLNTTREYLGNVADDLFHPDKSETGAQLDREDYIKVDVLIPLLVNIFKADKTIYDYHGKNRLNSAGEESGRGKRFATPKELVNRFIRDHRLTEEFWKTMDSMEADNGS